VNIGNFLGELGEEGVSVSELAEYRSLARSPQIQGHGRYGRRLTAPEEMHGKRGAKSNLGHNGTKKRYIHRKYTKLKQKSRWKLSRV